MTRQPGYFKIAATPPEKDVLSELPADTFTLLLKHRPVISKESLGLFDLQLSGHAHKARYSPSACLRNCITTLSMPGSRNWQTAPTFMSAELEEHGAADTLPFPP